MQVHGQNLFTLSTSGSTLYADNACLIKSFANHEPGRISSNLPIVVSQISIFVMENLVVTYVAEELQSFISGIPSMGPAYPSALSPNFCCFSSHGGLRFAPSELWQRKLTENKGKKKFLL